MAIKEAKGEIILLGNFNAYSLLQGRKYIASKKQAKCLLAKTNTKNLILITPKKSLYGKKGNKKG